MSEGEVVGVEVGPCPYSTSFFCLLCNISLEPRSHDKTAKEGGKSGKSENGLIGVSVDGDKVKVTPAEKEEREPDSAVTEADAKKEDSCSEKKNQDEDEAKVKVSVSVGIS
jgi:hypothetical protein